MAENEKKLKRGKREEEIDNSRLHSSFKNKQFSSLLRSTREVIAGVIQNATYIGRDKQAEELVFRILKNCEYLTKGTVQYELEIYNVDNGKKNAKSKSTLEKLKRLCKEVMIELHKYLDSGGTLCRTVRSKEHKMSDVQEVAYTLLQSEGATIEERIKYLQSLLDAGN